LIWNHRFSLTTAYTFLGFGELKLCRLIDERPGINLIYQFFNLILTSFYTIINLNLQENMILQGFFHRRSIALFDTSSITPLLAAPTNP
jgi:hypothetical protein